MEPSAMATRVNGGADGHARRTGAVDAVDPVYTSSWQPRFGRPRAQAPARFLTGTMTDVLSLPVLVLNRHLVPVQVTTVKRAIVLLYGGVALALDEGGDSYDFELWRELPARGDEDAIAIVGGALRVPRVLHLLRYERTPRVTVRLTRRNLMFRDAHQCQYCGKRPPLKELNIDHVLPRSRGGMDSWENLVTACRPCNLRKGWRTPEEANMRLARRPYRPRWTMTAQILLGSGWKFKEWEPFLRAAS